MLAYFSITAYKVQEIIRTISLRFEMREATLATGHYAIYWNVFRETQSSLLDLQVLITIRNVSLLPESFFIIFLKVSLSGLNAYQHEEILGREDNENIGNKARKKRVLQSMETYRLYWDNETIL